MTNWLNVHTEYSFRTVYGQVPLVLDRLAAQGATAAGIADYHNTFGHIPWMKECAKRKIKPVFGVVLAVVASPMEKTRQPVNFMPLFALNNDGLRELYELVKKASAGFYYTSRVGYTDINATSNDICVLSGTFPQWDSITRPLYAQLSVGTPDYGWPKGSTIVATQNNLYIAPEDKTVYELISGRESQMGTEPRHLLSADEWGLLFPDQEVAIGNAQALMESANATIQKAPMVRYRLTNANGHSAANGAEALPISRVEAVALRKLCEEGFSRAPMDRPEYQARLERELKLIEEKDFSSYFLIVADMVRHAKQLMLVGPARGSSAGSLVCYLTGITEIDPLLHGLLFERFIDINRADLPDIDLDFPDDKRELVVNYLREQYGDENVAHIGTVGTLQPRSAIGEFAKQLNIPPYETQSVKDAMIERSSGDARAELCIDDTFSSTEAGRAFIAKFPAMRIVAKAENHARQSGIHASGIFLSNTPITNYAGVLNRETPVAMIDMNGAHDVNLLKVDVLGLRTLTILEECINEIGMTQQELYSLPLDDQKTFELFQRQELAGIFQFTGYALASLTRQVKVERFEDISAITALARPGPLHNGMTTLWIDRRMGRSPVEYLSHHPAVIERTKETYGSIVYQETIMQLGREFGDLSWEDVSELRKAMSKSLGNEFFSQYQKKFTDGAVAQGVSQEEADTVWKGVSTFGSWGFNKSHAVGYGLLSYLCAYLKAHYPLAFAKANLNNVNDTTNAIKLLREFGYKYKAYDPLLSTLKWEVVDDVLIGPLTNVKGIGVKKAEDIIQRRKNSIALLPGQKKMLENGVTPYDDLYPIKTGYGDYYANPSSKGVKGRIHYIKDIQENGMYTFIGRLVDRNLRDLNEYGNVVKRGGKLMDGPSLFLNITLEDDTDSIIATVGRFQFNEYGKAIAESGKIGQDCYLIYGRIKNDWRKIYVVKLRQLNT